MVRELIRAQAREAAATLPTADPPAPAQLEALARGILARLKQPTGLLGWTMVELASGFWASQVASVAFSRRLFLVPESLVGLEKASPGGGSQAGLSAAAATGAGGASHLARLGDCQRLAEQLGYQVLASESSSRILEVMLSGSVDAIVGLGTLDDLEKALERILPAGIPALALPLLSARDEMPRLDGDWAAELITCQRDAPPQRTRTYVHLMRRAKHMFEPEELARLAPRLAPGPTGSVDDIDPLLGTEAIAFDFLAKGGKHSRPFITLAVYDALSGGLGATSEGPRHLAGLSPAVLRTAMSIETFHKASLVHDDIEDDDAYRYGEETLHRRHGTPTAINIGDYLIGLGYRLVSRGAGELGSPVVSDILDRLALAHMQLAQGQGAELLWRDAADKRLSVDDALHIYALKTAPAFEAALYAGVRLAGSADEYLEPLSHFARHLGVAFQIQNDLDDWDGDEKNKIAVGGDLVGGRPTVLWALALAGHTPARRAELEALVSQSLSAAVLMARVREFYQAAEVFARARQFVDRHAAAALEVARSIEPEPLRRLFYYLIDMVLDRPGRSATAEAEQTA